MRVEQHRNGQRFLPWNQDVRGGLKVEECKGQDVKGSGRDSRRTTQVTAQHKVKDEETVLIVLKGITQIDNERMVDLGWREKEV